MVNIEFLIIFKKKIESFDVVDNKRFRYYLIEGYDASDEGLKQFAEDFSRWVYELRVNTGMRLDYTKYFSHHSAVIKAYESKSKILKKRKNIY
jgi:hypothetical protein